MIISKMVRGARAIFCEDEWVGFSLEEVRMTSGSYEA